MITLICPNCKAESKLSFVGNSYEGPRRCWKCHQFFKIRIDNNRLIYCEPMSEEEYRKVQDALALKNKYLKKETD